MGIMGPMSGRRIEKIPRAPLGATLAGPGEGAHFALVSRHATAIELCLFDRPEDAVPRRRFTLDRTGADTWHRHVDGISAGQLYGYRVSGPWAPQDGHRFNPSKLLVDPWARAITGEPRHDPALYAFDGDPGHSYSSRDSAGVMPKSVVIDPVFDWRGDRPPRCPWSEMVIYEAHVKGLTMRHPEVPTELRGTYLGLASTPVVEHLLTLGVTAVELLPVHQIAREPHLAAKGLANYWGYSPLAFSAPHAGYARGGLGKQVDDFKTMVRGLHRAGLEVILDVVYNHTAEGGHAGPTLSFRGLDNRLFYRLEPRNRRRYRDVTGCGNTLDLGEPRVRELVLDSLRFWVREMHVDGFRFDLATALGREHGGFDPSAELFRAIAADPDLSRVKLIAEPWDLGPDGYQLGRFPDTWAEWNDRYRDAVRHFWRGSGGSGELAHRLAGSPDLYGDAGPRRSLGFVTCHDGFTLADLVSYEHKHNLENGEDNRDGHDHNLSRNWGIEGPTDDPEIQALRRRSRQNLLATLLLSRGVPMLLYGDELGRTQGGNNNAYCQDSEISWVDWSRRGSEDDISDLLRRLLELRQEFPSLRGGAADGDASDNDTSDLPDLCFFHPDGVEILDAAGWEEDPRAFAVLVPAATSGGGSEGGKELLLLLNGSEAAVDFELGVDVEDVDEILDTTLPSGAPEGDAPGADDRLGATVFPVEAFTLRALGLHR